MQFLLVKEKKNLEIDHCLKKKGTYYLAVSTPFLWRCRRCQRVDFQLPIQFFMCRFCVYERIVFLLFEEEEQKPKLGFFLSPKMKMAYKTCLSHV